MTSYYDLTRTNEIGDMMGLEAIFNDDGVLVRYYAKGHGNGTSHKTYYFDSRYESELREFINRETTGAYEGISCIDAMMQNFDHWLHSKQEFDHIQLKFAKDSSFNELKERAEQNRFEMTEEASDTDYRTYFAKVG